MYKRGRRRRAKKRNKTRETIQRDKTLCHNKSKRDAHGHFVCEQMKTFGGKQFRCKFRLINARRTVECQIEPERRRTLKTSILFDSNKQRQLGFSTLSLRHFANTCSLYSKLLHFLPLSMLQRTNTVCCHLKVQQNNHVPILIYQIHIGSKSRTKQISPM